MSNTLATWCKELTHWKRPWCWERLKAGGERDDRGWDGWMASLTRWTWVWASSRSWWRTGKPGVLQSMGSQRAGHDWATEHHHPLLWKFTHLDLYKQGHWEELSGLQVVVLRWTSRWGWRTRNRPNFVASSWLLFRLNQPIRERSSGIQERQLLVH